MSGENRAARGERNLIIIVLLILAVIVGYSEFARQRGDREARARDTVLADDIALVRQEAKAAFSALIPQHVVTRTNASVYAIVVNNNLQGTAFVVDRENGVLATAAHVADTLPLGEEGARTELLNRFNGPALAVTDRRNHAGYGAFRILIEDYQPVRPHTPILRPQILPLRDLAFDAALIMVDPIDPATGENRLGPDLPISSREDLLALSAGAPIAVLGFPYDTLDNSFAAASAVSRVDRGVISAMIAPLDNAAAAADPVISNLIIHRLSTAGGNSGSPIINAAGEVIGIHTHGIASTSSNADGAAQRADVLYDLLIEGRDQQRLSEIFIPAWTRLLSYWRSARDVLPWSFYLEHSDPDGAEERLVSEIDFTAATPFSIVTQALEFGEAQDRHIIHAADLAATATTTTGAAEANTLALAPAEQFPVFKIEQAGRYAQSEFTIDRSKNTILFAFDYSLRRRNGFCLLTTYSRRQGERRLAIQNARPAAELFLPAGEAGEETYSLTFHRQKDCDPASNSFYAGAISWDDDGEDIAASKLAQLFFPVSDHAQFQIPARSGVLQILSRARAGCFLAAAQKPAHCGRPEFIEVELLTEPRPGAARR